MSAKNMKIGWHNMWKLWAKRNWTGLFCSAQCISYSYFSRYVCHCDVHRVGLVCLVYQELADSRYCMQFCALFIERLQYQISRCGFISMSLPCLGPRNIRSCGGGGPRGAVLAGAKITISTFIRLKKKQPVKGKWRVSARPLHTTLLFLLAGSSICYRLILIVDV